eukprot:313689_1
METIIISSINIQIKINSYHTHIMSFFINILLIIINILHTNSKTNFRWNINNRFSRIDYIFNLHQKLLLLSLTNANYRNKIYNHLQCILAIINTIIAMDISVKPKSINIKKKKKKEK